MPVSIVKGKGWHIQRETGNSSVKLKSQVAMPLQAQSPSIYNQLLSRQIPHPASTKFEDDYETPAAKRLKRFDNTGSSLSRREESEDEEDEQRVVTPTRLPQEIPDSEAGSDDEDVFPDTVHKTDLESALPPVKTDKEAIAEYEATRAAESEDLDLRGRLGQRKWVHGRSSIYVDAFNLALETVLEDESHLFDEAEMSVFEQWRDLSYEGQYL